MVQKAMRILVDILHPAHVHVFRNLAAELTARGHQIRFTLREKECARELLDQFGIHYEVLSTQRTGSLLALEFLERTVRLWRVVNRFRPHFLTGVMGPNVAFVGRLRRLAGLDRARIAIFYDTEKAERTNRFTYPMADYVCTPDCYEGKVGSNHELAYLHPNRFEPDPEVVRATGVDPNERYFVVRFVSYQATHDVGVKGLHSARKIELVRMLAQNGRVLISSEGPIPPELEHYRLNIRASEVHHFLAFASLLVGESATMASECAVLGVPSVHISPMGLGYTDEQERRYGLVFNFTGEKFKTDWMARVRDLVNDPNLKPRARQARQQLLAEKIDVTTWMIDFFEREFARSFSDAA